MKLIFFSALFCFIYVFAGNDDPVTCGSVIKLQHEVTGYFLHSHPASYGTGSQQQSVTAFPDAHDSNSLWLVKAGFKKKHCSRGEPIKCGSILRLEHVNTRHNLHSHQYKSPLSQQQEISCFGENGEGDKSDDWKVLCRGDYWKRETPVKFVHVATKKYLHSHKHEYQHPIAGQREVTGYDQENDMNNVWVATNGFFFTNRDPDEVDDEIEDEL
eukprot:TRINITY_DN7052_c0_g1_i1.p1 TRINITY_DN7052_c0_g1~~TRINITY_DN7052_c0_g1_i1.p1  ORF type:complete len:227 (-),score=57.42 TRINITY_DN7052_c0_g1_i1:7-648(-)